MPTGIEKFHSLTGEEEPDVTRDEFQELAWGNFILFAWTQDEAHAVFRGATGRPQRPHTDFPLGALIDRACGVDENSDEYAHAFIVWATQKIWGEEFAPKSFRERGRLK